MIAFLRNSLGKIWFPIRAKITLPFLLLTIIGAIILSYLALQIVNETVEARIINQVIESGQISSEFVVEKEKQLLENLRTLSFTQGISEFTEAQNPEGLRELILPIAVNANLEIVDFVNSASESILSVTKGEKDETGDYSVSQGGFDLATLESIAAVLAGESDEYGDKFSEIASLRGEPTLVIAGPILNSSGDVTGAVIVGERISSIIAQMREATLAQISIYDLDGRVILSSFLEQPGNLPVNEFEGQTAQFKDQIYQRDISIFDNAYKEGNSFFVLRGAEVIGFLGTAVPESAFVQPSDLTLIQIILTGIIGAILIIWTGSFLADRISTPLSQLVGASERVAKGGRAVIPTPNANDEVRILSNSFNKMVDSVSESKQSLLEAYDETIEGWAKALELKDKGTEGHTRRVTDLTMQLAERLGAPQRDLVQIKRGAMLHDIGKMAIPESILNKPGKLTDDEWLIMKSHPDLALDMLGGIEYLKPAIDIPFSHHEKLDGSGYPLGLSKEKIPYQARIFAVVDIWDALSSDRPYRKAWKLAKVANHIYDLRNSHLDPRVVDVFLEMMRPTIELEMDYAIQQ